MTLARVFATLTDFLFPKDLKILELETMSPGELLSNLSAPHSPSDVGPDTIVLFSYVDPRVRELIWELKYRHNDRIAMSVAGVLYDTLQAELAERALFDNFNNPILVPMPISAERRRERGYNQVEALCEKLKTQDDADIFEYRRDVLMKIKDTQSQARTKDKKHRLSNVENSMEASKSVKGRNIILLDDVTTTGATLRDARRALKAKGAKNILCVAIAH